MHADHPCHNCGRDFADHNYVKDSIDQYACPYPRVETSYGAFHGGDPRQFHPDGECCTPEEAANHKAACELWHEAEARGETPEPESCPSGWIYDEDGKAIAHVLRCPYGIGIYQYEFEQFFEAQELEESECDDV